MIGTHPAYLDNNRIVILIFVKEYNVKTRYKSVFINNFVYR